MCCKCCSVTQQKIWVFGFGTIFLILGLIATIWGPTWMDSIIYNALPLSETSETYDKWITTPIPVYMYMYLFNWTNTDAVHTTGVKPNFQQLGPYVFREHKSKEDVVWHANKTVSFYGKRTWFFEPEMSGGSLDDLVTCPHLPSLAASSVMRDESKWKKRFFNIALNNNGGALFQTHTAIEWLFDGFYDEFLAYALSLNNSATAGIDSDHFAWFLNRNGSKEAEGYFTVHTGQGDLKQMGDIKFWNGQNHTGFYDGDCGRLNGSTSDLFEPNMPADRDLTIFITDTCRILNLKRTNKTVTLEGLEGEVYETQPDTFDNGQLNADMQCYCSSKNQPNNCYPTGVTDLGPCGEGVPMVLSHPHFMYADSSYINTTTGMQADYERDRFYIVMLRKLGVPLQVNANIQVSLHMRPDNDLTILRNIPEFYAPLFVVSSKATINAELAKEVKLVLKLPGLSRIIGIVILTIGVIFIAIGIALTYTHNWRGDQKLSKK